MTQEIFVRKKSQYAVFMLQSVIVYKLVRMIALNTYSCKIVTNADHLLSGSVKKPKQEVGIFRTERKF